LNLKRQEIDKGHKKIYSDIEEYCEDHFDEEFESGKVPKYQVRYLNGFKVIEWTSMDPYSKSLHTGMKVMLLNNYILSLSYGPTSYLHFSEMASSLKIL
jgi:hypothetical protein